MSSEDPKGWIYAGGLPYELSEGDVICAFSQYGEVDQCILARDKETGKSRGFGFVKYQDARSCELAVDNFNGTPIIGRKIKVSFANNINAIKTIRPSAIETSKEDKLLKTDGSKRHRDRDDRDDSPDLKRRHDDNSYENRQRHRDAHHKSRDESDRNNNSDKSSRHRTDKTSSRSETRDRHHRHRSRSESSERRHHRSHKSKRSRHRHSDDSDHEDRHSRKHKSSKRSHHSRDRSSRHHDEKRRH